MPFNQTGDNVFPFEPISLLKAAPWPRGSDTGRAVSSFPAPPRNACGACSKQEELVPLETSRRNSTLMLQLERSLCLLFTLHLLSQLTVEIRTG